MFRLATHSAGVLLVLLLLPAVASAQAAITGVVKDASGAVLPGVTVEAASPVLIEKVRSVVTDGTGQYRIVNLLPGTYSVTFGLPGFSTVKREGIELTGAFVATVNGDLKVGALEETITVTGETPVVDVQSVKVQQTVSKDVLAAIPTARTAQGIGALIPGLSSNSQTGRGDVGGAGGVHGGDTGTLQGKHAYDSRTLNDGLATNFAGANAGTGNNANVAGAQEIVISTSGGLGEAETSGVVVNLIPRDGGNTFTGTFFLNGATESMQGSNYTPELKAAGLTVPEHLLKVYDLNPMGGGRIVRDKLWFYYTDRVWGAKSNVPGMFINKNAGNPNAWNYDPDLTKQATTENINKTHILRLTWQASERNKFTAYWSEQYTCLVCIGGGTATTTPEATSLSEFTPSRIQQATYSSPITSRLLAEAGFGTYMARYGSGWTTGGRTDGTYNPQMIRVTDQNAVIPGLGTIQNLNYRAAATFNRSQVWTMTWRGSLSYVTGAHNMKFGYLGGLIAAPTRTYSNSVIQSMRFSNGTPNQITVNGNFPEILDLNSQLVPTSLYAQDQWTRGKLTLQGGVRYDYALTKFPQQSVGGTPLIPKLIDFPAGSVPGLSWSDITPRMGLAYDLFGNGKTAVKFNLGKYMESVVVRSSGDLTNLNPIQRIATQTTRSWTDSNRNYVVDCDLANVNKNAECGDMANKNLGSNAFERNADTEWTNGWGQRQYNWNLGVSIQQEVAPRVSVNFGFYRNWFRNQPIVDNLAVDPSSYTKFTFMAPVDSRLPGGGGYPVTDLYNLLPGSVGLINEFVTSGKNYPEQTEYWQGVNLGVAARMRNGLTLQGGAEIGHRITDNCALREVLPELGTTPTPRAGGGTFVPTLINYVEPTNPYCRVVEPYQPKVTGLATYTIPKADVQVSTTWQSNPGLLLEARYQVPNAVIRQYLGRDLSAQAANLTINMIPTGTLYGARLYQMDFRVAKIVRFKRTRTQFGVDLYNALNSSVVQTYNETYSPNGAWLTPTSVLTARFVKLSVQFDF
jgi:hypothetical protein